MKIPREILLSKKVYEEIKIEIEPLKNLGFSSSSLTAFQKNADTNQTWPLLNLVRQILKVSNYNMVPQREANGRTKEGKKKYKRFFVIKKFKPITEAEMVDES